MHTEDFLVNNGSNRKTVEAIGKCFPEFDVVAAFALIVETIDSINGCTFVISTKDEKVFRVLDLVSQQKTNCFQ